jgi:hypothetical protein
LIPTMATRLCSSRMSARSETWSTKIRSSKKDFFPIYFASQIRRKVGIMQTYFYSFE